MTTPILDNNTALHPMQESKKRKVDEMDPSASNTRDPFLSPFKPIEPSVRDATPAAKTRALIMSLAGLYRTILLMSASSPEKILFPPLGEQWRLPEHMLRELRAHKTEEVVQTLLSLVYLKEGFAVAPNTFPIDYTCEGSVSLAWDPSGPDEKVEKKNEEKGGKEEKIERDYAKKPDVEAVEGGKKLDKQVDVKDNQKYEKGGSEDEDEESERRGGKEREKKEGSKVEKKANEKDEEEGVNEGNDEDKKEEERKHSNDKETENKETKTAIQAEQHIESWELPLTISKEDMGHTLILNTRTGTIRDVDQAQNVECMLHPGYGAQCPSRFCRHGRWPSVLASAVVYGYTQRLLNLDCVVGRYGQPTVLSDRCMVDRDRLGDMRWIYREYGWPSRFRAEECRMALRHDIPQTSDEEEEESEWDDGDGDCDNEDGDKNEKKHSID